MIFIVDDDDRDQLAHTALQRLVNLVYILSNPDFQWDVWVFGKHYVNSYEETVEMFEDALGWLVGDELWRRVGLTAQEVQALRELFAALVTFDRGKRGLHPKEIITSPDWNRIRSLAEDTMAKIVHNSCGIRPSID